MIPVGRLAPVNQWDQNLLDQLFDNKLYPTGLEFRRVEGYPPHVDGCVLLVPGRYWHQHADQINQAIQRFSWVLGMRCGDEEDLFDISKVEHPNLRWWVQTPRHGRDYGSARLFGVGFPPHFNDLGSEPPEKKLELALLAQNTHERRKQCFKALQSGRHYGRCVEPTEGFTQGYGAHEYMSLMRATKVAPCPSGAVSPDSFRFWEALEAHAIPIADAVSPVDGVTQYWQQLFDTIPFPVCVDWANLPGWVGDLLAGWPANANRITAAWMRYKRSLARGLRDDLQALGVTL